MIFITIFSYYIFFFFTWGTSFFLSFYSNIKTAGLRTRIGLGSHQSSSLKQWGQVAEQQLFICILWAQRLSRSKELLRRTRDPGRSNRRPGERPKSVGEKRLECSLQLKHRRKQTSPDLLCELTESSILYRTVWAVWSLSAVQTEWYN